jgi:hypothetical protein
MLFSEIIHICVTASATKNIMNIITTGFGGFDACSNRTKKYAPTHTLSVDNGAILTLLQIIRN